MLKLLELFAGIGACSKALERLGIEHEIVDAVEIDKYAIASFNAIHGTNFKTQDITTWDKDIEADLIMHGSPCQDFSLAGKQAGGDIGSGTRSSLMYETIRIVGKLRPKYVVWENVKNLLSKKHKHNFDAYIETMNILGYNSYYQVLNAKNYGIPQNRERVFTISIRKDIDDRSFKFPEKEPLKLRLKDILEEQVDEKYYLSDKMMNYVLKPGTKGYMKEPELNNEIAKPLLATMTKMHRAGIDNYITDSKCVQVGTLDIKGQDCIKRVYSEQGLSPTLTNMQGGNRQPKIITYNIEQKVQVRKYPVDTEKLVQTLRNAKIKTDLTNKEIAEQLEMPQTQIEHYFRQDSSFAIPDSSIWLKLKDILKIKTNEFDESIMTFEEKDGVYEKANRIYDEQGLAPTLTQQEEKILVKNATKKGYDEAVEGDSINLSYPDSTTRRGRVGHQVSQTIQCNDMIGGVVNNNGLRIRKLTPKECWRLMGFDDKDFEKAEKVNSNTQLYKQARKLDCR